MKFAALTSPVIVLTAISSALAKAPSKTNVPTAPEDVLFETDIHYRMGHDRWVLNVIRPQAASERPRAVVVLVHGGGWTSGDHYRFSRMGFTLAQKGYVVVTPTCYIRSTVDVPQPFTEI